MPIERVPMALTPSVRRGLVLDFMVTACAAFNLTKAVHIDDAGHLEIARSVLANPFKVMPIEINRDNTRRLVAAWGTRPLIFCPTSCLSSQ
jgi:hypothetical protein